MTFRSLQKVGPHCLLLQCGPTSVLKPKDVKRESRAASKTGSEATVPLGFLLAFCVGSPRREDFQAVLGKGTGGRNGGLVRAAVRVSPRVGEPRVPARPAEDAAPASRYLDLRRRATLAHSRTSTRGS